jgi:hypothetical protein
MGVGLAAEIELDCDGLGLVVEGSLRGEDSTWRWDWYSLRLRWILSVSAKRMAVWRERYP